MPILIDSSSQVIAGHARLLACRKLGWTEVPTICLDHLSEAQARAYVIADNRLAETSDWNDELLAEALQELSVMELEFSLDTIGFDMGEIDFRIETAAAKRKKAHPDDQLPPCDDSVGITAPGDLWLLGRHRLLCASALEEKSFELLMEDSRAAMVFTDPPYNVPIRGHVSGLGRVAHREFPMASGELSSPAFADFLSTTLNLHGRFSLDGSLHFVCMDWRHLPELLAAGSGAYSELKNLCVWTKDNAGMGSLYRSQHELVFVYKRGRGRHRNNVELGVHGQNRTNVWTYPGANSFARKGEEGFLLDLHPTVKPVQLVADAMLDCSGRGEIVLDGFMGSGTTLIAAERVGRAAYGIELDPRYVDTAVRRWQSLTGEAAVHACTGQSFAERQALASATGYTVQHISTEWTRSGSACGPSGRTFSTQSQLSGPDWLTRPRRTRESFARAYPVFARSNAPADAGDDQHDPQGGAAMARRRINGVTR